MLQPRIFYTLDGRWTDEFSDDSDSIYTMRELNPTYQKRRHERNTAYSKWLASFFTRGPHGEFVPILKGKIFKWQAIQILTDKHSENNSLDWWHDYQDCLFRVFLQPETLYDQITGEHKQWYLLSPEDCYLVNKNEIEKAGRCLEPREIWGREKWLSGNPDLRRARLVPVECCRHWKHETTAGKLPEGL